MNWKKASVALITTVALGATLSGCNRGESAAGASKPLSSTMVISTLNNPFFVSVADGAKAQAESSGMKLDVQNANNKDQALLDLTSTALTKQPSVLIVDPVSSDSGASVTNQANQANVPVVAFDREPSSGELASFIGYNAIEAGKAGAKALGAAVGGKGKVVEIQGIMGTSVAQDRSKGFNEGIKAFPGIQIVAVQAAEFDRGKALDVMTNVLQAHPDIDGVYAANDEMAMGVVSALKARGLSGTVKVVGNDGIADALAAIKAGTMYATNAESPFVLGKQVVNIAAKVAKGDKVDKHTVLEGRLVTSKDVSDLCSFLKGEGDTKTCAAIS